MSDCKCQQTTASGTSHVPDFSVQGFGDQQVATKALDLEGVLALNISACVSASYDPGTNKICFKFPVIGSLGITSPIQIPGGAELKVCGQTCGSFLPKGLKITLYVNGSSLWSGCIWGNCSSC